MPLLARCCGKLYIPHPHHALRIPGTHMISSQCVWAFMWNITSSFFVPFFPGFTIPSPAPDDSMTQLRNATNRNVSVGGGEAVQTQLGQTLTVHTMCLRRGVDSKKDIFKWRIKSSILLNASSFHLALFVACSRLSRQYKREWGKVPGQI